MRENKKELSDLINTYKEMTAQEIEHEVNLISDNIYAILTATENVSIQVEFDRLIKISFSIEEIQDMSH